MKRSMILGALVLSSSAMAIENGSPADWVEHSDLVEMNCTGTIIAGQWVLTAAHCKNMTVHKSDGSVVVLTQRNDHPQYIDDGIDVTFWKFDEQQGTTQASFLSNTFVAEGEPLKVYGFGQTSRQLNYATHAARIMLDFIPGRLDTDDVAGSVIGGDSGAAFYNSDGFIVSVLSGLSPFGDGAATTRLSYIAEYVLEAVDAWHFATRVDTATETEITIQSLHRDAVLDQSYTTGDATIIGGTCVGATVAPFETCTLTISSPGFEGRVYLSDSQYIVVNASKTRPATPPPVVDNGDGGSSGGSFGWLTLSILGLLRFRRCMGV